MHATPHDALFKAVLGAPEHAAGVLQTIVPAEVGEAIEWRALSLCSGSFVDTALAYQHSDLLFSARWRTGQEALLYFLMEHQSSPPTGEPMAFRMLRYQIRIWERWWKENAEAPVLPVIVPLVLYHGAARWSEVRCFEELHGLSPALRRGLEPYLVRASYLLHDLSEFSEQEIAELRWHAAAKLAAVLLQKARADIDMMALLHRWLDALRELESFAHSVEVLTQIFQYILEVHEATTQEVLDRFSERKLGARAKEAVMTAAQRLRQEGREEGREEGRVEGRVEASRKILLRQVQQRFGAQLSHYAEQRIGTAPLEQIEAWLLRVLSVNSVAELLAE